MAERKGETITGVVLAGGAGRRMGGNKPGQTLNGRPLLHWVIDALRPQVDALAVIVAPGVNLADVPDDIPIWHDRPQSSGPMAALLGAADSAKTPLLLTAPTDVPFLPADTADRLATTGPSAVAHDGRPHWTIGLHHTAALAALPPADRLSELLTPLTPQMAPFPPGALRNINTLDDLAAAEADLLTFGAAASGWRSGGADPT